VRTRQFSCPVVFQLRGGRRKEKSRVTDISENSANSNPALRSGRNTADYLYQGATILAALLLVLSAAV
jgi:hypothetical protein